MKEGCKVAKRRILRREIAEYQRLWRNHFVDKELLDDWLTALNSLKQWKLTSICSGHVSAERHRPNRFPHINIRCDFPITEKHFKNWNFLVLSLKEVINRIFSDCAYIVVCEINTRIIAKRETQSKIVMRFQSTDARSTNEMDSKTVSWFEDCIKKISYLDEATLNIRMKLEEETGPTKGSSGN